MDSADEQLSNQTRSCFPPQASLRLRTEIRPESGLLSDSHLAESRAKWDGGVAAWRSGEFLNRLSPDAISQFESLAAPCSCEGSRVLQYEGESPATVLFLLDGRVKLSLESIDGRRLTVRFAVPGEILGLAAVVSGRPYEMTAETQVPCQLISLPRCVFLQFIESHPIAGQNVGRQLSREYKMACAQMHDLNPEVSTARKLARFLLDRCAGGHRTNLGRPATCPLSHAEIGECIGVPGVTVSRILSDFKHLKLVEQRGANLFITDVQVLQIYAD
jgi:CRP/FNR family transcriptional regulator